METQDGEKRLWCKITLKTRGRRRRRKKKNNSLCEVFWLLKKTTSVDARMVEAAEQQRFLCFVFCSRDRSTATGV